MIRLIRYLVFQLLIGLILGITFQFYTNFWQLGFAKLITVNVLLISLLLFFHRVKKDSLFTVTSWILIFFVGISSVYLQNDKNNKRYYENFVTPNAIAVFEIQKVLKPSRHGKKYIAKVVQVNQQKTVGSVLVYLQKDTLQPPLQVDDKIILKPIFKQLASPANPHQFSYKDYLAKQGVFKQVFIKKQYYKILNDKALSLIGIATRWRISILNSLQKYPFSKEEFAVIEALLLGQKTEISRQLLQHYSKAGVIHILAVSGLHIGIIYLILSFLFNPLSRFRFGRIFRLFFIALFLWGFALLAGLSASVVRAVTMFSFVALGSLFQRKKITAYTLITSMFVLLLFKPLFLFDVGFELSYLAVFGIVWIQPKLYRTLKIKSKSIRKIWQLITVSIAAQLGILPISLFYFHQFPGLFLLANLVIVPLLGFILTGGITVILLALFNVLPLFIVKIYGDCIFLMNQFVGWVATQKAFLFEEIPMSFLMMVLWYLLIISTVVLFSKRSPKRLSYFLISIVLLQFGQFFEKYQDNNSQNFVVFHQYGKSIIVRKTVNSLMIYTNLKNAEIRQSKVIKAYRIGEHIACYNQQKIPAVFGYKKQLILSIDSLGVYPPKGLIHPIILLENSPRINLSRLIKTLSPSRIIADGSNYKNIANLWQITCKKQQIPFYNTYQKGAFVFY